MKHGSKFETIITQVYNSWKRAYTYNKSWKRAYT